MYKTRTYKRANYGTLLFNFPDKCFVFHQTLDELFEVNQLYSTNWQVSK